MFQGRTVTGAVSGRITVDGRPYVNFFGSGYLALSDLPEVRGAVLRALHSGVPFSQQTPAALGASDPYFDAAERAGACALGAEASVYLPSGYLIGMVLFAALEEDTFDYVLIDEGAHYSLKDAATLSKLPTVTYTHASAQSVNEVLKHASRTWRRPLLVTDGVFATTGRIPPLADYAALLERYDGLMLIDESHAFGVVGANGRGAAEHCGVERMARVGATLSKALCAQGAVVACTTQVAKRLSSKPPIRAACAGSPLSAAAATASLEYSAQHPRMRTQLRTTAEYLRTRLRELDLEIIDSPAPIVSFTFGNRAQMRALQEHAWERGICLYHSNYLGADDQGTIRCAVFRDHLQEDVDALIATLASFRKGSRP